MEIMNIILINLELLFYCSDYITASVTSTCVLLLTVNMTDFISWISLGVCIALISKLSHNTIDGASNRYCKEKGSEFLESHGGISFYTVLCKWLGCFTSTFHLQSDRNEYMYQPRPYGQQNTEANIYVIASTLMH